MTYPLLSSRGRGAHCTEADTPLVRVVFVIVGPTVGTETKKRKSYSTLYQALQGMFGTNG